MKPKKSTSESIGIKVGRIKKKTKKNKMKNLKTVFVLVSALGLFYVSKTANRMAAVAQLRSQDYMDLEDAFTEYQYVLSTRLENIKKQREIEIGRNTQTVRFVTSPIVQANNKWNYTDPNVAGRVYNARKEHLRQSCGSVEDQHWVDSMQMVASPEHNLVVCVVQKAGSTNWLHTVENLRDEAPKGDSGARMEAFFSARSLPQEVKEQLRTDQSATRVILARHPLARLYSLFNQKFRTGFTHAKYMSYMPPFDEYKKRHPITSTHALAFQSFLEYVVENDEEDLDKHFQSIEMLCSPCEFTYDFVVKVETAPADSWFVTDRINTTLNAFTSHSVGIRMAKQVDAMEFWEMNKKVLETKYAEIPDNIKDKLLERYRVDMERFQYSYDIKTNKFNFEN